MAPTTDNKQRSFVLSLILALAWVACGDARPGRAVDDDSEQGGGGATATASSSSTGGDAGTGGAPPAEPPPDFSLATRTVLADGPDFGRAVDLEGGRLAIGTQQLSSEPKVYIYTGEGSNWTQEAILASGSDSQFYMHVDLSANHVVVEGDHQAYLFARNGTSWSTTPTSVTPTIGGLTGVSVDGEHLALTASGAAVETYTLNGSNAVVEDRVELIENEDFYLGCSIDVHGTFAIAGTCVQPGNPPGKAYILRRVGQGWAHQQELKPDDGFLLFGTSVAIDDNTAVVGGTEAAYVFGRDQNGVWHQEARLEPMDTDAKGFGHVVDVSGDVVVVGAPETIFKISTFDVEVGAAYVFVRENGSWHQQVRLEPEMPEFHTGFGRAVAVDGKTLVVGEHVHELVNIFNAP